MPGPANSVALAAQYTLTTGEINTRSICIATMSTVRWTYVQGMALDQNEYPTIPENFKCLPHPPPCPVHSNLGKVCTSLQGRPQGRQHGLGCFRQVFPSGTGLRSVSDSCPGIGGGAGATFLRGESSAGQFLRRRVFQHHPSLHRHSPVCPGG